MHQLYTINDDEEICSRITTIKKSEIFDRVLKIKE